LENSISGYSWHCRECYCCVFGGEEKLIDVMFFVFVGFILGAASYTAYGYVWQRRRGFSWLSLTSMLVSLVVDVAVSPLLNVPGAVPLVLRGLGSGYVLLSSFAFGVMVNFFVAKPLVYFSTYFSKASFMVGRGRTVSSGFWQRRAADVSQLRQPVKWKFRRLWLVVIALAILLPASFVFASLQYQATISTHGNIKAVGVQFYSDSAGLTATSQINWGTLEPGQTVNVTLYMKNTSNVPVTASMAVGNFVPASGSGYLACTWNYNGATISLGQLVPVTFTLVVATTVTGITAFSFDISVVGAG
jgi:hypothetical protein